jgi:hypothetical protein
MKEERREMGAYQSLGVQLNQPFSPESIHLVNPSDLAPGIKLVDAWQNVLAEFGGYSEQNRQFAQLWSDTAPALEEAVRASLYNAVNRDNRLPVTFGGRPSSHFEVTLWETSGGLSILLGMPLPR